MLRSVKPNTQDCVRCRGMGSLAAPFILSPLERLEGPSFAPCGGYGGLERFWLGLCLSAPRREVTPGTWLAEPFARWQARSLPCQRSGPGRTAPGSETDAEDTQNDNKTAAQVSNSARRFPEFCKPYSPTYLRQASGHRIILPEPSSVENESGSRQSVTIEGSMFR